MFDRFRKPVYSLIIILASSLLITTLLSAQDTFIPAKVKDISDRTYEPEVIKLLDGAHESIVMSMYSIRLGAKGNNPVKLLLNDLLEALERGVSVTLYLNTRFRGMEADDSRLTEHPEINKLRNAGCVIHFISYHRRLHDKLIIVDRRFVVEGSTNWSISALRDNYESATLIDSPELANIKLVRLKSFILPEDKPSEENKRELYTENLPKDIAFPCPLLEDKRYLPKMLSRRVMRGTDLYFLLVAYSQSIKKTDFFIDMGAMGLSLGLPESWSNASLRRQVIKSLRDLKKYKLINVKFFYNKDAWVELVDIPGDTFAVGSELILEKGLTMRARFYLMAKALLESQGEDINTMSGSELGKRFHLSTSTFVKARRDLAKEE
ncbi:MAG: hypothetical protein HQ579_07835 [Candidatus Omnitrophica bacterium]|nr:hypothetical protein [Candidatus Omnitrophota bacterium]